MTICRVRPIHDGNVCYLDRYRTTPEPFEIHAPPPPPMDDGRVTVWSFIGVCLAGALLWAFLFAALVWAVVR